jgi:Fibronectin type III domain
VKVTTDGVFSTFRVAARSADFNVGFLTAIAGNRIFIASDNGNTYVLDTQGNVSSFVPCKRNPSEPIDALNGLIGPDGELWVTCYDTTAGPFAPGLGYLARVTLDATNLADSTSTYYGISEVPAMGTPFFMTIGADGNIWVAQLVGTPPSGSPLPFDPSASMLRISFPDGYTTPVIEAFDSDVLFMLDLVSSSDGYMYANQFTLFAYYVQYFFGGLSTVVAGCYQTNSPTCEALGIQNFNSLGGIFRIDVGTPAAPTLDVPTAGSDHIDLTWTAPSYTGVGPVVGYRIKYSTHADMSDATVIDTGDTSLSRTLSNLPKGKYYVRIATTNTIVTGPYSPARSVRVVREPTKFPTLTATPGDGRVTLAYTGTGWDAGDGEGTGVGNSCFCTGLGYEYSIDDGSTWQTVSGVGTSSMTINGLDNFRSYSIKVRAVNTIGTGPASDAVVATPIQAGPNTCTATAAGKHGVLACWGQLIPSRGSLVRYRAYVMVKDTLTKVGTCKGSAVETSCTIKRPGAIAANTTYDVRIRVKVKVGPRDVFWTEYSSAVQVTTNP